MDKKFINAIKLILVWIFIWLLIMSFSQGSWSAFLSSIVIGAILLVAIAVIASIKDLLISHPISILALIASAFLIVALIYTGTFNSLKQFSWDMFGILIGFVLSSLMQLSIWLYQKYKSKKVKRFTDTFGGLSVLLLVLYCWIGITLVTLIRPVDLPSNTERFDNIQHQDSIFAKYVKDANTIKIGMALSGGGYRAALFHSGTIHALESLGVRINTLSTVSGGSIIGAFYAQGGDPVKFKETVANGQFNLKREMLLIHNFFKLFCPMRIPLFDVELIPTCNYSRVDVQSNMLNRLFIAEKNHKNPETLLTPNLIINSTDLIYGLLVGFLNDGLIIQFPDSKDGVYRKNRYQTEQNFSLAKRVAISGAFPIAFPHTVLNVKINSIVGYGNGVRSLNLTDGGVADNTGFQLLKSAYTNSCTEESCDETATMGGEWKSDLLLVSDGGAIFGVENELSTLGQLSRAVDISGAKAGNRFSKLNGVPVVHYSAQRSFLDPGMQFRDFEDEHLDNNFLAKNDKYLRFNPLEFEIEVLEKIAPLISSTHHPNIEKVFQTFIDLKKAGKLASIDKRKWSFALPRILKVEPLSCTNGTLSKETNSKYQSFPAICEAALIRDSVRKEVYSLLNVFRNLSTLDDQPGEAVSEKIFRLGELLVYLEFNELKNELERSIKKL